MSTDLTIHGHGEMVGSQPVHDTEHEGHHHKETFITKYVFSQDHKMICKQFLIAEMNTLLSHIRRRFHVGFIPTAAGIS